MHYISKGLKWNVHAEPFKPFKIAQKNDLNHESTCKASTDKLNITVIKNVINQTNKESPIHNTKKSIIQNETL